MLINRSEKAEGSCLLEECLLGECLLGECLLGECLLGESLREETVGRALGEREALWQGKCGIYSLVVNLGLSTVICLKQPFLKVSVPDFL